MTHTLKVQKLRNPNSPLTISRVDEMKVSELKEELKQRGQKVNFSIILLRVVVVVKKFLLFLDFHSMLFGCKNGCALIKNAVLQLQILYSDIFL